MKHLAFLACLLSSPAWAGAGNIAFLEKYAHAPKVHRSSNHARHNGLLAYAERFLGDGNITGFHGPWCGAQMRLVAKHEGYKVPRGYLLARNWLHAGPHIPPRVGAVAVLPHHVGIVSAVHRRTVTLLSGNHGHRVGFGKYPKAAILAFVELRGK